MNKAIQILITVGVSAGAALFSTGCATTDAPSHANANGVQGNVTDVRPIETAAPAAYQPPVYDTSATVPTAQQPLSVDPVVSTTPSHYASATASASGANTAGEKTHTVRHGETLFSIAKATYGDGKKWKQIVSVNPGVSPSKLKVGQVLVMPS